MALRSKTDLAREALMILGVVDALNSPTNEDGRLARDRYDDLREELIDDGLAYWPNTNATTAEIPAVVFSPVAHILAGRLASHFQAQEPTISDRDGPTTASMWGFRQLRRHMAKRTAGEPVKFSSF